VNSTERSQILQMVESGQVSVEDAIGMMSSVGEPLVSPAPGDAQRWLRIRVTNLETGEGKVNVNIPLSWIKFGFTLGSCFAPELEELDIDEAVDALDQSTAGHIVQVEDIEDNQRVEIYVE
jgi:hypothetical protein